MANTDLFKQISTTVSEAGKSGLEKAKELRDTARISMEIRDRENSIQKAYRELGKAYYQDHRNDVEPAYDQVVYIKAAFEEIGELKANKDEVRGIRRCSACGEIIPDGAAFCPKCGKKYDGPELTEETDAEKACEEPGDTCEEPVECGEETDYGDDMVEEVIEEEES